MARKTSSEPDSGSSSTATIGFEAKLWLTADKLRNNMDAAEYKHVVLGLIFLKYISDTFEEHRAKLLSGEGEYAGANPEDPDEYTTSCVVRCLVEMHAPYKGRIYAPACGSGGSLPASRLCRVRFAEKDRAIAQGVVQSEKFVESHGGKIGDISIYGQDKWARRQRSFGLATRAHRVSLRGQQPKQNNATNRRLAVMNLALRGIEAYFGAEHADTFRRDLHPDLRADYVLANSPLNDSDTALRGSAFLQSEAKPQVGRAAKDNFRKDDYVRWQWSGATWTTRQGCPQGERGGVHQFGVQPKGNANFAWVQHFIHHLAPQTAMRDSAILQSEASPQVVSEAKDNMAGFVLANGSISSNQTGDCPARSAYLEPKAKPQSLPRQRDIRRALIEGDLVDCMVALPCQIFYSLN